MTTPNEDETVTVAGVTVGKTRRVVFTALAVLVYLSVVLFVYSLACDGFWRPGIAQHPDFESYVIGRIPVPALTLLPVLCMAAAEHNSPVRAVFDLRILLSAALVTATLELGAAIGSWRFDGEQQLATFTAVGDVEHMENRVSAILDEQFFTPVWLLIPSSLTIAFIVVGARRRIVRDAALLAAGEDQRTDGAHRRTLLGSPAVRLDP